jgi:hypothetical protein
MNILGYIPQLHVTNEYSAPPMHLDHMSIYSSVKAICSSVN